MFFKITLNQPFFAILFKQSSIIEVRILNLDRFSAEDFQVISGTTDLRKPTFKNYAAQIHVPKTYNQQDCWRDDIAILKVSLLLIMLYL